MSLIDKIQIDGLGLLHGKPILIPSTPINVFPVKLKDISSIGVKNYYRYLNLICLRPQEIEGLTQDISLTDSEIVLTFLIFTSLAESKFKYEVLKAFRFFTHEQVYLDKETKSFYIKQEEKEDILLTFEIFEAMQYIIKKQNHITKLEDEEPPNPANERAKAIMAKQRKGRENVEKYKKDTNEEKIEFFDLVGSLAARGNGLNILNVWNLTYYAFNDQLQRLKMIEEYSNGVQSIIAGADAKKVKLKYWIRSIQSTK